MIPFIHPKFCVVILGIFLSVPSVRGESPALVPAEIGDWPCWLGVRGDGVSRETGWSCAWPKSGPKIAWTKEIGRGYSSFAAVGDRVYTMGHLDEKETVYCLEAATGQAIWTHTYPCEIVDNLNAGGPCATPTIDGNRVYTHGRGGQLFCLKAESGEVIWQKELRGETGLTLPEWGFSSSPLIRGDRVLIEAGRLIAFDKLTGDNLWQTAAHRMGYGTPSVFQVGGVDLVASLNNDSVLVAQFQDGKVVAERVWKTDYATSSSTPVILDDQTLFISTGYKRGCARLQLTDDKLKPLYEVRTMSNHFNNSILWKGHLYGVDGNSHNNPRTCQVRCIEAETGALKWGERGFGCASVLLADEKLIILSDDGVLCVADANPQAFHELARATILEGQCWTVPVLSHGRLFARTSAGSVVCVDLSPQRNP